MYVLLIYLLLVVYGFPICCNINFLILVSTSCATPVSTSCATPVISTCATPVTSSAVTSIPSAPPLNDWLLLVKYDHLNKKMYTRATEYM
nr:uncharacterized protein LOC124808169 isoform X2 [Hydra vulgaris]